MEYKRLRIGFINSKTYPEQKDARSVNGYGTWNLRPLETGRAQATPRLACPRQRAVG